MFTIILVIIAYINEENRKKIASNHLSYNEQLISCFSIRRNYLSLIKFEKTPNSLSSIDGLR